MGEGEKTVKNKRHTEAVDAYLNFSDQSSIFREKILLKLFFAIFSETV